MESDSPVVHLFGLFLRNREKTNMSSSSGRVGLNLIIAGGAEELCRNSSEMRPQVKTTAERKTGKETNYSAARLL